MRRDACARRRTVGRSPKRDRTRTWDAASKVSWDGVRVWAEAFIDVCARTHTRHTRHTHIYLYKTALSLLSHAGRYLAGCFLHDGVEARFMSRARDSARDTALPPPAAIQKMSELYNITLNAIYIERERHTNMHTKERARDTVLSSGLTVVHAPRVTLTEGGRHQTQALTRGGERCAGRDNHSCPTNHT